MKNLMGGRVIFKVVKSEKDWRYKMKDHMRSEEKEGKFPHITFIFISYYMKEYYYLFYLLCTYHTFFPFYPLDWAWGVSLGLAQPWL